MAEEGDYSGAPYADMGTPAASPGMLALLQRALGLSGDAKPSNIFSARSGGGVVDPTTGAGLGLLSLPATNKSTNIFEARTGGGGFGAPPAPPGMTMPPPMPGGGAPEAPPPGAPPMAAAPPVPFGGAGMPGMPGAVPGAPPPEMPAPAPAAAPPEGPPGAEGPLDLSAAARMPPPAPPPEAPPKGPPGTGGLSLNPTSLLGRLGKALGENPNTLMMMGAGFAGAPSFGQGMSRAFAGAAAGASADQKLKNENQTVEALVKRGVPREVAVAAAGNPTILQQLVPQLFGAKQQQHVTIKDRLGNEIALSFDPSTGKYRTASGEAYGTGGQTGMQGDVNLTGQAFLDSIKDPLLRNEIKAFGEYRTPVTARNLQTMLPYVTQAYPGFDATRYPTMLALRKSYEGGGKDFQEVQALNTVGGHMGKLAESADKLPNTSFPIVNRGMNWFRDTFTGSPEMTRFRNDLVTTSNELAKAYHGGHVSDASYAAFQKGINEAQTPAEMKAAIGEIAGLLQSKIAAKESGFRQGMNGAPLPEDFKALNEEAQHSFQKIHAWSLGIKPTATPAAPAAPAAPVVPKPGKYQFDPGTGTMRQM